MPVRCRVGIETTRITNNIRLGNSVTAITAAYTDKALQVYTTSPSTNASTAFEPVLFNTVQTGAGAIPVGLRVNLESNVKLGAWANALYASMDLKTSGGTAGAACVVCSEITMGAGATEGTFGLYEAEVNCPTSWTGAGPVSYLYFNSYGATKANFDTYGNFLWLTGATGASGKFLSAASQTLRCYVNATSRYLVLSQIEDGVGLGTSGTPMTLGTTPVMSVYTTCANASTEVDAIKFNSVFTAAAGINVGLRVNMECNYKMGTWANAAYVSMDLKTNGGTSGLASVLCAELTMGAAATEGTFAVFEGELNCPASWTGKGPVSFIYLNVYGNTKANFDDYGYFLNIDGVSSGSGDFFYDNTANAADACLKCKINGAVYYLPLSDDTSF